MVNNEKIILSFRFLFHPVFRAVGTLFKHGGRSNRFRTRLPCHNSSKVSTVFGQKIKVNWTAYLKLMSVLQNKVVHYCFFRKKTCIVYVFDINKAKFASLIQGSV